MSIALAVALPAVVAQAQTPLFEGQSFAITNAVAAADFLTTVGDSAFARVFRVDDPIASPQSLSNPALGYNFSALALETPLSPLPGGLRRTRLTISLTHANYDDGYGDFFPGDVEVNGLPLQHQVFAFGGSSEPDGLFAGFALAIETASFRTFAFDGTNETPILNFSFSSPSFDGGAGFWTPPPGVSVGNEVNRIEWVVDFVEIPTPSAAGLFVIAGLAAGRRRR
jgi:hypothetical protein